MILKKTIILLNFALASLNIGSTIRNNFVHEAVFEESTQIETATPSSAEEDKTEKQENYDEKKSIVLVRLLYENNDGNDVVYRTGYAFFVGDKNSEVYLIANHFTVNLTEEEKENLANSMETSKDKIKTKIEIVIKSDVIVEATIVNGSSNMDFCILTPSEPMSGCTTVRLCENANINENGSQIYGYNIAQMDNEQFELDKVNATMQ